MTSIAIDLGGTNLRVARIEDGRIASQVAEPCKAEGTKEEVIEHICQLIDKVITPEATRIGAAVPSVVDYEHGIIYNVQNIPSWDEVHLKEILEKRYGIETNIDNDVNCFVWGEKTLGDGKPYKSIVGITLGTGVGAGIVIDDKLHRGANTGAGEIGCLPYLESDYEHYTSSQFFKLHGTTGADEAKKMAEGDEHAKALWEEFGFHLGKLLQVILFTYDPECIIIGGGISASAQLFEGAMRKSMHDNFPYPHEAENVKIVFSKLKDCNLLGASQL